MPTKGSGVPLTARVFRLPEVAYLCIVLIELKGVYPSGDGYVGLVRDSGSQSLSGHG